MYIPYNIILIKIDNIQCFVLVYQKYGIYMVCILRIGIYVYYHIIYCTINSTIIFSATPFIPDMWSTASMFFGVCAVRRVFDLSLLHIKA